MRTTAEPQRPAERSEWFIVPRPRGGEEPDHLHFDRLAREWRAHVHLLDGGMADAEATDLRARKSA